MTLAVLFVKTVLTVFKMDMRGTQTNGPKNKDIDYTQSLTLERRYRQIMCQEKKEADD